MATIADITKRIHANTAKNGRGRAKPGDGAGTDTADQATLRLEDERPDPHREDPIAIDCHG